MLRGIYARRGITSISQLNRNLSAMLPMDQLGGITEAVSLLAKLIEEGGSILVVGDFDCDGATSSALAVLALRAMGCAKVDYLVPNRFHYGYGLTTAIVQLAQQSQPDLIITVDNGISSHEGVAAAGQAGIPVIITDHHLPGPVLPDAAAIVNPNLPGDPFPAKGTAGVGVIFYVLLGLRAYLRDSGWFQARQISEPNMADFLDLVALGTVADVVPLESNNRILVHQGLERIRAGRCRPGITALLQIAGRSPSRVKAADLGFAVGPRLNAAGRLDDMSLGIECLLAESLSAAQDYASRLDTLNRERRHIEEDMKQDALAILESWKPQETGDLPWGLCMFDPGWHQGVIGILASRLKERFHRPVIAFAPGDQGELRGSARSIKGLHIRDVLDEVAAKEPGLLKKFGGHAMAAGMSLDEAGFDRFSQVFDAVVREHLTENDLSAVIQSDGDIPPESLNMELATLIEQGGPWGQAFPEPVFDGEFKVLADRVLQGKHWKLVVQPLAGTTALDAIGFNLLDLFPPPLPEKLRLAYQLDINEYRGNIKLQLRIQHMEPA